MTSKRYIEAPHYYLIEDEPTLFLAGGITNCADWQSKAAEELRNVAPWLTILNPRRANWNKDPKETKRQIRWEWIHLNLARHILFWFSPETDNPVTLYELGYWAHSNKPITVGADPEYRRLEDVYHQLALARPGLKVHTDLYDTCNDAWFRTCAI